MTRRCLTVVFLVGACSSPDATSFHERLHRFANAGMVRVGDLTGKLDPARLYSARECAVLSDPNATLQRADLDMRLGLCIKPEEEAPIEVASAG